MSADLKVEQAMNDNKTTDDNRALHYEENLLWEKERSDTPGVDLPAPAGTPLRTGADARGDIGLPQV